MKNTKLRFKLGAATVCAALSVAATSQAGLSIVNGDFEEGSPAANGMDVLSWFDANQNGQSDSQWWLSTWYGPAVSPTATSVMGLSWTSPSWAYQSIGVNDGGLSELAIQFDVGSFTDAGGNRDLGVTVGIYQSASFVGADDTDIDGAAGVTLIDSVSMTTGPLAPGAFVTQNASLNLASANGTDPLYLRFLNYAGTEGAPWTAIDNVLIVPEPTTMALAGLGIAGMFIFRRRR